MSRALAASRGSICAGPRPGRPRRRTPAPCRAPRRAAAPGGARPHLAVLVLEPRQQAIELVALEVQLGHPADHAELGVEVLGLVEGPPVHLDRLLGPVHPGEVLGEREDDLGVVGIDPHGASQGVEPLVGPAELEAELREELVVLGVAGCRGEQVAAGLDGRVDPAQPRLQPGDAGQVLGAVLAVDLGEATQGIRRRRPGCRPTRGAGPRAPRPGPTGARPRRPDRPPRTASGSLPSASR